MESHSITHICLGAVGSPVPLNILANLWNHSRSCNRSGLNKCKPTGGEAPIAVQILFVNLVAGLIHLDDLVSLLEFAIVYAMPWC